MKADIKEIGEIFEHNGEWYQCVEQPKDYVGNVCKICSIKELGNCELGRCSWMERSDDKSVIFKKLEKVGEPVVRAKRPKGANNWRWFPYAEFQEYKVSLPVILPKEPFTHLDEDKEIVYIEIKENKEDMEDKKTNFREEDTPLTRLVGRYVNNLIDYDTFEKSVKELYSNDFGSEQELKPFSLELAKAGKHVCTRDGRKARIIAIDLNNKTYPLAAVIENNGEENEVHNYTSDGLATYGTLNDADLMMLPEKKEGWINVYALNTCYSSKEEAEANIDRDYEHEYVRTVKIEWEE